VNLVSNPQYAPPSFAGFWNDGSKPSTRYETVDGLQYLVNDVETVLYPLEAGKKTIDAASIKIAVRDLSAADDFDSFFGIFTGAATQVRNLATDAISINVMPLPSEGKPADFNGAVGNFTLRASVDKTKAQTNEPITLTVSIGGTGNMRSVSGVDFKADSSFKQYDAIVSKNDTASKEFKIVLVPYTPGGKEIPPAKLSFFSPDKKTYLEIQTAPIKVSITGEAVSQEGVNADGSSAITKMSDDINYNKQLKNIKSCNANLLKSKAYYFVLLLFAALFFASFAYAKIRDKKIKFGAENTKHPSIQKALKFCAKADETLAKGDIESFNAYIYKALIEAVCAKTGLKPQEANKNNASDALKEKGVSQETINGVQSVFSQLEFHRFASIKADGKTMSGLSEQMKKIIEELKK